MRRDAEWLTKKRATRHSLKKNERDARTIGKSGTSPRSWTSVRQDTGMGEASQHGAEIFTVLRGTGWIRERVATKNRVNETLTMLIGEVPELSVDNSRPPGKSVP